MEFILWGVITFAVIYSMNKEYEVEISPWLYVIGSVLLGGAFGISMYLGKFFDLRGKQTAKGVSYTVAGFMVLVNVLYVL